MPPSQRTCRCHRYLRILFVCCALAAAIGCSRFKQTRRLDLRPFAEDMIAVAGDIQYGLGQVYPVYVRGYADMPEAERLGIMAKKARAIIRGTIAYSMEIVSLAESRMSGAERSQALANYLDGLLRPILSAPRPPLNISVEQLDTLIADVASQTDLLGALGAAQPIIDEAARVSAEVFDDAKEALDAAVAAAQRRIDAETAPVLEANRLLRDAQLETTFNIRFLGDYRRGDPSAIDSLLAREPSLADVISSRERLSAADLRAIEDRMMFKLRSIREVRDQLVPDLELYWKQQAELEELTAAYNQALRQAHVAVIAWSRAHKRMAAGITNPADIDLLGIAKKAAGNLAPIP